MEYLEKTTISHEDGSVQLTEFSFLSGDSPMTCYREHITVRQLIQILNQLDQCATIYVDDNNYNNKKPTECPLMKVMLRVCSDGKQRIVL